MYLLYNLQFLSSNIQTVSGPSRKGVFQDGWIQSFLCSKIYVNMCMWVNHVWDVYLQNFKRFGIVI